MKKNLRDGYYIDSWRDKYTHSWVIQLLNKDGYEIMSDYAGTRASRDYIVKEFEDKFNRGDFEDNTIDNEKESVIIIGRDSNMRDIDLETESITLKQLKKMIMEDNGSFRDAETIRSIRKIKPNTKRPDAEFTIGGKPFGYTTVFSEHMIDCSWSWLRNLNGSPEVVDGSFDCGHNDLVTLEGGPKRVEWNFYCCSCKQLESLKGAPEVVGGNFHLTDNTKLTSLDGAPRRIDDSFYCEGNWHISQEKIDEYARFIKMTFDEQKESGMLDETNHFKSIL